jgi:two-component system response regulator YesN
VVELRQLPAVYQEIYRDHTSDQVQNSALERAAPVGNAQWKELLQGGKAQDLERAVREEINRRRKLFSEESSLSQICQELMDTVDAATGNGDVFWRGVLVDAKSYDLYRNASKSEEELLALVSIINQRFGSRERGSDVVDRIIRYIDAHLDQEIHRSDLAEHMYMNPDHLNRLFKKQTGKTLKEFVSEYKMNEARKMLQITNLPVSIIAAKVGFDNFSHFSYAYKKVTGQSPLESRNSYRAGKETT